MGDSFRQSIANTFSRKDMNEEKMLSGHLLETQTRSALSEGKYLLIAQDTTHYNYTGHKSMKGLGIIQQKTLGILQHNVLVMNELGTPLGIIAQKYWSRSNDIITTSKPYTKKATQQATQQESPKESQKWFEGLTAVNTHLQEVDKIKVLIQDREADIYDFFKAERGKKVELITRIFQNRNFSLSEAEKIFSLKTIAGIEEHLITHDQKTITIQRNNKDVKVTLSVKSTLVTILNKDDKQQPSINGMTLVIAEEINPLSEKEKICWYLLTSLPVENSEDAFRVLTFYGFRWRIERLHFTLKSGAYNVEKLQFDDIQTIINALTFYSVASWKLLVISYLVKEDKEHTPEVVFDKQEIEILKHLSQKETLTLKQAILILAKLVGFVPSKKQPMPGIKILSEALDRFHYVKIGFKGAKNQNNLEK